MKVDLLKTVNIKVDLFLTIFPFFYYFHIQVPFATFGVIALHSQIYILALLSMSFTVSRYLKEITQIHTLYYTITHIATQTSTAY